jgi:hypothetical protein
MITLPNLFGIDYKICCVNKKYYSGHILTVMQECNHEWLVRQDVVVACLMVIYHRHPPGRAEYNKEVNV